MTPTHERLGRGPRTPGRSPFVVTLSGMSIDEIVHSIDASIAEIDAKNARLLAEREKLWRAREDALSERP